MDVKRRTALVVVTLAIALGAGHLVQNGRTTAGAAEPAGDAPGQPSGIVVLSASTP